MNTKHILFAALCCATVFNAQAQEITFQRNKVLIEKFTGQNCPNCPTDDNIMHDYLTSSQNEKNVAVLHHYSYRPSEMLALDFHFDLNSAWGITEYPSFLCDRTNHIEPKESRKDLHYRATVIRSQDIVTSRLAVPTYVNLSLEGSSYNPANRSLRLIVSGQVAKDLPYLRLNAFLTQSGIKASQSGASNDYVHNDISRAFLTSSVNGDPLTPAADGTFRTVIDYTLPERYGNIPALTDNMSIVAFVSSYVDTTSSYPSYITSEVHNADVVQLSALPALSPCDTPSITLKGGKFVLTSTTPGAVCTYTVTPVDITATRSSESLNTATTAFIVKAHAEAEGYAPSLEASRTFTMQDILGTASNDGDINGDGKVDKADVEELVKSLF